MAQAFLVDAVRTPIGRYGGVLSTIRPDDLLAQVIRELIRRNPGLDPSAVEDVIAGDANQAGEDNRNVARMAALLAGLPVSVAGVTVNRLCASGMEAVMQAARAVICGEGEVYIAAGVESMTRAPFILPKAEASFTRSQQLFDSTIGWRLVNRKLKEAYYPYSMGETAENVATRFKVSREQQDAFALKSQEKYFAALAQCKWDSEIVPVEITPNKEEKVMVVRDEHPRQTSLERLAALKPAFSPNGSVTAGNSSGINDGAAALLVVSESALSRYSLTPMGRIRAMAVAGVDPAIMGMGPVPATRKAITRAGLKIADLELIELNEAFASQSIACIRELGLDSGRVNLNGGAIALGHPLGCSGARILCTLIHELNRSKKCRFGLATMCVGVGQGAAMVVENT